MNKFNELYESIMNEAWGDSVDKVISNTRALVKQRKNPETDKLLDRMTINAMKEKRNKLKGNKKQEYSDAIDKLESSYKKQYN